MKTLDPMAQLETGEKTESMFPFKSEHLGRTTYQRTWIQSRGSHVKVEKQRKCSQCTELVIDALVAFLRFTISVVIYIYFLMHVHSGKSTLYSI